MTGSDVLAIDRLSKAFTPNRPIDLPEFLAGRTSLLYRMLDAANTPGQHVILYGDRGIGKTSIAHVMALLTQEPDLSNGQRAVLVSCDANDTYGSIWRKVFQEVVLAERRLGFTVEGLADMSRWDPGDSIQSPNDARLLIHALPNPTVIVVDEFDRVPMNSDARRLMADTIKLFSDRNVRATIILVGVADSVSELIAEHQSVERNIAQVPVEAMSVAELAEIIKKGFASANMPFEDGLDERIARLSQGYPHYTHLLGLWAGRITVMRSSPQVDGRCLDAAIPAAIENVAGGMRQEYEQATDSTQPDNLFKHVLLACALAEKDSRGRFGIAAIKEPLERILGRPFLRPVSYQTHLAKFCDQRRGPVLRRVGSRRNFRWQFTNPQLVPFIRLQGVQEGLIPSD